MAIAGKVAITPGGEWSVDVAYDKLVVVTFGNNVYLSIKPSTGIEPTNEEHWMLLIENVTQEQYDAIINGTTPVGDSNKLGGKGASEYVQTTVPDTYISDLNAFKELNKFVGALRGSTANIPSKNATSYAKVINIGYSDSVFTQFYAPNGEGEVQYRHYVSWNTNPWGEWKRTTTTADLANYVSKGARIGKMDFDDTNLLTVVIDGSAHTIPYGIKASDIFTKSGGTINGTITVTGQAIVGSTLTAKSGIELYHSGTPFIDFHYANDTTDYTSRIIENSKGVLNVNGVNFAKGSSGDVLHTGNKPSGSYTGNGSDTSRTINTGGIGNILVITSIYGMAIVTSSGGTMSDAVSVTPFGSDMCYFYQGSIGITSNNDKLNKDGVTYTYQVL